MKDWCIGPFLFEESCIVFRINRDGKCELNEAELEKAINQNCLDLFRWAIKVLKSIAKNEIAKVAVFSPLFFFVFTFTSKRPISNY